MNTNEQRRMTFRLSVVAIVGVLATGGYFAFDDDLLAGRSQREVANHTRVGESIDDRFRRNDAYRTVLNNAAMDLAENRITLRDATERLSATEQWADPIWRRRVTEQFPANDERVSLASSIVQHAERSLALSDGELSRLHDRLRPQMAAMNLGIRTTTANDAPPIPASPVSVMMR